MMFYTLVIGNKHYSELCRAPGTIYSNLLSFFSLALGSFLTHVLIGTQLDTRGNSALPNVALSYPIFFPVNSSYLGFLELLASSSQLRVIAGLFLGHCPFAMAWKHPSGSNPGDS